MQIVIDIPDYDYRHIKEYYEKNDIVEATYSYIYHGIPLPKSHGRLIDADALMKLYGLEDATKYGNETAEQQTHSYSTMMMYEIADMIDDAPTIIEADKAGEEEV